MKQVASAQQTEVDALNTEYAEYIARLRRNWLAQNRSTSRDVYEVMNDRDREEVKGIISRWVKYITPLAEKWWKEHGYSVVWPKNDSEPMQVYKPENETT
jgi:hypothetical protein